MDREIIVENTLKVFEKVFGENTKVEENTSADDIQKWDSLNHIILIQALEKRFDLKFDLFEIIEIKDVRGIVDYVYSKIGA